MNDAATIAGMERHILIAGRHSAVLDALVLEALNLRLPLLVTQESGQDRSAGPEGLVSTIWNRRSPLSARSVIIRAANVLETIDEVIVVYQGHGEFRPFHELSSADIETTIDADVKGYLFLLREVLLYLNKQGSGILTLVFQHPLEQLGAPLEAGAAALFRAIGDELFAAYNNEPIVLRGFESTIDSPKEFAQFVLTAGENRPERTRGKWLKYTGKSGLFSFVR